MGNLSWRNTTSLFLSVLIAGLINEGVNADRFRRVVGGSDAKPGEIPWQASLRRSGSPICGGTIIGKRHILTAAHCIVGVAKAPYAELTIATGSNIRSEGEVYEIADIMVHDKYVPKTDTMAIQNDIAVISLKKEIKENKFQKSVSLPNGQVPNRAEAIASGFGRTGLNEKGSNVLKKFTVTLMSKNDCLASGVRTRPNQICGFHSKGNGVCRGDSGGPLVYNGEIVGVISTAIKCGDGFPDTYTEVHKYVDFIKRAIETI